MKGRSRPCRELALFLRAFRRHSRVTDEETVAAAGRVFVGAMRLLRAAEPWDYKKWRRYSRWDGYLAGIAELAIMETLWAGELLKAAEAPTRYFVVRRLEDRNLAAIDQ